MMEKMNARLPKLGDTTKALDAVRTRERRAWLGPMVRPPKAEQRSALRGEARHRLLQRHARRGLAVGDEDMELMHPGGERMIAGPDNLVVRRHFDH